MNATQARAAGAAAMAMAFALYMIGAGRPFGFDAALTVRAFIATPSPLDAFRRQVVLNNHPAFSFLEHLVYTATGSWDETLLRVLPALFGAAAVGVFAVAAWHRVAPLPAALATVVFAAHPMFVTQARDVRGYSLLTLCTVASTVILLGSRRDRAARFGYGALIAVGIATHLYMLFVVALHAALIARRDGRVRWWVPTAAAGCAAGATAYLSMVNIMRSASAGNVFRASFPTDLGFALGGSRPAAVATLAACLAVAAVVLRRYWTVAAVGVMLLTAVWLTAPPHLYARFFVWMVPGAAVAVAVAVNRFRLLAVPVAAVAVMLVVSALASPPSDTSARDAGEVARSMKGRVCAAGWSADGFGPYLTAPRVTVSDATACDIVFVLSPSEEPDVVAGLSTIFPFEHPVRPGSPAAYFARF